MKKTIWQYDKEALMVVQFLVGILNVAFYMNGAPLINLICAIACLSVVVGTSISRFIKRHIKGE